MSTKAQIIDFLLTQIRDNTQALIGGTATFYLAGTTSLKNVYLDRNKTVIAANPYTLDANATAQLYGDGLYRIVVKTAAGVTIFDRDNLNYTDYSNNAKSTEMDCSTADTSITIDSGIIEIIAIRTGATAFIATIYPPPGHTINGNPLYELSNDGETVHLLLSGTNYYSI